MFHRVATVEPLPDFELLVTFRNGDVVRYDVKPLFSKWEPFSALQTVNGLFGMVRVDQGGYGIVWNDELDLSCNELWENGSPVYRMA